MFLRNLKFANGIRGAQLMVTNSRFCRSLPRRGTNHVTTASADRVQSFSPPPRPQPVTPPDPNLVARGAILSYDDQFDFLDHKAEAMLARCIAAHGPIALGECYGFFPALARIGTQSAMRRVENIRRVPAIEHFAVLAQAQPFHLTKVGPSGIEEVREIGCPLC